MNINGIETDDMYELTDERLFQLLVTADGKGMIVKEKALKILLDREFEAGYKDAETFCSGKEIS